MGDGMSANESEGAAKLCVYPDDTMFDLWAEWIRRKEHPDAPLGCPEWPEIRYFTQRLSGHASFTADAWQYLLDWLQVEHGLSGDTLWRTKRTEVVALLRAACQHRPRRSRGKEPQGRKKRIGKRPLEERDPLKFQVYERIQRAHRPGQQYTDTLDSLKGDQDFVGQVKEAGLKLTTAVVRAALALFDQRRREARKKQDTKPS
jgi:hypothetical protein